MEQQEKMFTLVEDFYKSGTTQKDYCLAMGISASTFSYWIKKKRISEHPMERFLKIETKTSLSKDELVEIIYPNGVRLKTSQTDMSVISALIRLY